MKKLWVFGLILCLVLSTASFGAVGYRPSDDTAMISGEIVVAVEPSRDFSTFSTSAQSIKSIEGFTVKDALWESVSQGGDTYSTMRTTNQRVGDVYLMTYSNGTYKNFEAAKKALENKVTNMGYTVKYIEPNYEVKAFATIPQEQQWHYEMIKVPQAWQVTTGSSSVKVAVLDTGVDHNHANLRNNVNTALGKNFTSGSATDTMDRQSHGTHVAGTIAAYGSVTGVMQTATIIPVKVLGDDGTGSTYGIQQGIIFAADQGADVINMSLGGGGFSQGMNDACEYAVGKGTIVVAATGNDGVGTVSYPAAYPSVIAVGSVDANRSKSWFSNYGQGLEIMAPGSNIYSTTPNNQFASYSGTSMATPHVAGVAGLMRAANPNLTVAEARQILRSTAQPAGASNQYGYGIVDAAAAVQAATGGGGTPTDPVTVTGYEARNVQTWEGSYWWWTTYNISADIYIVLSDGTTYFHGTESASSYNPNPSINKTVSGTATANSTGESVPYQVTINVTQ
ncbi:S8 family peptidase [Fusibacter sp. JL298sf-3]